MSESILPKRAPLWHAYAVLFVCLLILHVGSGMAAPVFFVLVGIAALSSLYILLRIGFAVKVFFMEAAETKKELMR